MERSLNKSGKLSSKPCPRCGNPQAEQVQFTWWGGFLGASMLHQVKCTKCGLEFNGETGEANRKSIWVYSLVVFAIVIVMILVQAFLNH
jgi:hypothetical protein